MFSPLCLPCAVGSSVLGIMGLADYLCNVDTSHNVDRVELYRESNGRVVNWKLR